MKNLIIILTLILASCDTPVVFDDPYPKNVQSLSAIPDQYGGVYMCESDSTIITINDQMILALEFNYFKESIVDLNERVSCTLIDDEVYIDAIEDCIPIEYIGQDSVVGHYTSIDTLFLIKNNQTLKPYKGSLILSQRINKGEYILSILSLDAYGNILYRAINENSDLEELDDISEMKQIGVDRNSEPIYKVKPTRTEFEKIFDNPDIFLVCEYLIRINLEEFPHFVF